MTSKKQIIAASIAAIMALSAAPAFADRGGGDNDGDCSGNCDTPSTPETPGTPSSNSGSSSPEICTRFIDWKSVAPNGQTVIGISQGFNGRVDGGDVVAIVANHQNYEVGEKYQDDKGSFSKRVTNLDGVQVYTANCDYDAAQHWNADAKGLVSTHSASTIKMLSHNLR